MNFLNCQSYEPNILLEELFFPYPVSFWGLQLELLYRFLGGLSGMLTEILPRDKLYSWTVLYWWDELTFLWLLKMRKSKYEISDTRCLLLWLEQIFECDFA